MTSVHLERLWLTSAADLTDSIALHYLTGGGRAWPTGAAQVAMGGGRVRLRRTKRAQNASWTPALRAMSLEEAAYLEAHAGEPYWSRDALGQKIACFWEQAPIVNTGWHLGRRRQEATVALTLLQFSLTEGA